MFVGKRGKGRIEGTLILIQELGQFYITKTFKTKKRVKLAIYKLNSAGFRKSKLIV